MFEKRGTAMVDPAAGFRLFSTAPAPVCRPQPSGPSSSSGASAGTGTTERAATTAWVANDDWPKKCEETTSSPERRAEEPSARRPPKLYAPNSLQ